jgi:hypothetical protein
LQSRYFCFELAGCFNRFGVLVAPYFVASGMRLFECAT